MNSNPFDFIDTELRKRTLKDIEVLTYTQIKERADLQIQWIIKQLVSEGSLVYIGGASKVGKSFIAIMMAKAIANGEHFLSSDDFPVKRGNVLYIDEENGASRLGRRIKLIEKGLNKTEVIDNFHIFSKHNIKLDEEGVGIINEFVAKFNINVIIFDSLVRFIVGDEDKAADVRETYNKIKQIQKNSNLTIIILHHLKKNVQNKKKITLNDIRGSGDIGAMADVILGVVKGPYGAELQLVESRDGPTNEQRWQIGMSGVEDVELKITLEQEIAGKSGSTTKKDEALAFLRSHIISGLQEQYQRKELFALLEVNGYKKSTIDYAIKSALHKKIIKKADHGVYEVIR